MAADNRLTADELVVGEPAIRSPVESAREFVPPRLAVGTVVRVAGPHIVVSCKSPRG